MKLFKYNISKDFNNQQRHPILALLEIVHLWDLTFPYQGT